MFFFLIISYLVYLTMIQICCGQRHWKADFDLHVGLGCGRNSTEFFFLFFPTSTSPSKCRFSRMLYYDHCRSRRQQNKATLLAFKDYSLLGKTL